jgi:CcmD family protein
LEESKLENLTYLFAAYAVIWTVMLVYSYSISARQKSLDREVRMLKAMLAEQEAGVSVARDA